LVSELLLRQARIVALVHHPDPQSELFRSGASKQVAIVQGDLENYQLLEQAINKYEIDTVFHLGAQAIVDVAYRGPLLTFEANIRGTYNILEACRRFNGIVKRVVIASSDKAYGTQDSLPYLEEMPLQGRYPYEVSKTCADLISQSYYHTYALPVAIARCGNIYGGGDLNWSRIIPCAIRACHNRTPIEIRSDGTFIRDYIYVKDVTKAYILLAERLEDPRVLGNAFNFSPRKPLSVLELVANIQKLMNCEDITPMILNTAKGEIHSQYLNSSKAKDSLGWQPLYSLDEGLLETIAWYQDYLSLEGKH
jgi:CDP-glucose 4,6-dehydratase